MRYTIYVAGNIMGTYFGNTEADAFNALAVEQGHADSTAYLVSLGLAPQDMKSIRIVM